MQTSSASQCIAHTHLKNTMNTKTHYHQRLKKVVAKSRARVYFEQQILALLLVFHQTHNLSRNKIARALANQPTSAPHFFNPQQMFLLRVKLFAPGEKRETTKKTCNETMLRDKWRVFVPHISPPLLYLRLKSAIFPPYFFMT